MHVLSITLVNSIRYLINVYTLTVVPVSSNVHPVLVFARPLVGGASNLKSDFYPEVVRSSPSPPTCMHLS